MTDMPSCGGTERSTIFTRIGRRAGSSTFDDINDNGVTVGRVFLPHSSLSTIFIHDGKKAVAANELLPPLVTGRVRSVGQINNDNWVTLSYYKQGRNNGKDHAHGYLLVPG
jgi:hypothetical protein